MCSLAGGIGAGLAARAQQSAYAKADSPCKQHAADCGLFRLLSKSPVSTPRAPHGAPTHHRERLSTDMSSPTPAPIIMTGSSTRMGTVDPSAHTKATAPSMRAFNSCPRAPVAR